MKPPSSSCAKRAIVFNSQSSFLIASKHARMASDYLCYLLSLIKVELTLNATEGIQLIFREIDQASLAA